jgi:hypothetical protein
MREQAGIVIRDGELAAGILKNVTKLRQETWVTKLGVKV